MMRNFTAPWLLIAVLFHLISGVNLYGQSDTLWPPSFSLPCGIATPRALYTDPNGGYVFGTNSIQDQEKAQKFILSGPGTVTALLVDFAAKKTLQPGSQIFGKLYTMDANGAPDSLLGISNPITMSDVDTALGPTPQSHLNALLFSSPIAVPDSFFASIDFSFLPQGEELGIYSTVHGCKSGTNSTWDKRFNGEWRPTPVYWTVEVDMAIGITGNLGVGLNPQATSVNRELHIEISPNPAADVLLVRYTVPTHREVSIKIYDLGGRVILDLPLGNHLPGRHELMLYTDRMEPEVYILQVIAGKHTAYRKFVIGN